MPGPVKAEPYCWPYDGNLRPDNTAFVIIDMQVGGQCKGRGGAGVDAVPQWTRCALAPFRVWPHPRLLPPH